MHELIEKLKELLKKNPRPAICVLFIDKAKPKIGMYDSYNEKFLRVYYPGPDSMREEEAFLWDEVSGFEEMNIEQMVFLLRQKDARIVQISRKLEEI